MAHHKSSTNDTNKPFECSICFSGFHEPKQLPCLHTFCLQCLKQLCKEEIDGNMKPCPLCRREFCIPRGGVAKLRDNQFMIRILATSRAKAGERELSKCELCSVLGENADAKAFCTDCNQCLCVKCMKRHSVTTTLKSHKVVAFEERPSEEKLVLMNSTCCSIHKAKEIEFYCWDCYKLLCSICHFEIHSGHRCALLDEVAKQRREALARNEHIVRRCLKDNSDQMEKHKKERERTLHEIAEASQSIDLVFSDIIKHITNLKEKLKQDLQSTIATSFDNIDSQEDLDQLQNTKLHNFLEHSKLLLERGTDCEIIRVADELHKRAEELIKSQDERNKQQLPECYIKFIPSSAPNLPGAECLIGRLDLHVLEKGKIESSQTSATQSRRAPPPYNSIDNMSKGITGSLTPLATQLPTPPPYVPLFYGISTSKGTSGPTTLPVIQPPTPPASVPNFYNIPPVTDEQNSQFRRTPHYSSFQTGMPESPPYHSSFQSGLISQSPPVSAVYPKLRPPIPAKRSSAIDRLK